ncbi:AAA family ATPase [uncultured Chryseobacterium sp.]|uniref:AAA family ATPase n=1 Tax=uncultured Chryseobacterium sp. TaxID=259322 RepID=UPI0025F25EB1|nr:ATP-binding protein [uncultured Chryseobacterium sp.]
MEINKILIKGFSNIEKIDLELNKLNALIALNNYGKSNVLKAIDFGIDFISNSPKTREKMMAYKPYVPFNKFIDNDPFYLEINLTIKSYNVIYDFAFDWIKSDKNKGKRVISENLKVRNLNGDSKYTTYIKRDEDGAKFLPSKAGRCNKHIKIENNELIINKLSSFDELFYLDILDELNNISIAQVDTLQKPDEIFTNIKIGKEKDIIKNNYSLSINDIDNSAYFIYSLMKKDQNMYELFKDSILSLLPSLEDFEPIEINLKDQFKFAGEKSKIPLDFPEKFYDIRVKERNNNQQTSIVGLSSGSQKIFYVISVAIAAEINKIPLITFEELENSIHPGLLQRLLIVLDGLVTFPKIIFSSHSPYLIQYLDFHNIKMGIPNQKGLAIFNELKKNKYKKLLSLAEDEGISLGDLLFEKMIENDHCDESFFNEMCV